MAEVASEQAQEQGLLRLFSLKYEFPNKWHRFLHPTEEGEPYRIEIEMSKDRFPFMFQEREIVIATAYLFLKLQDAKDFNPLPFELKVDGATHNLQFANNGLVTGVPSAETPNGFIAETGGAWEVAVPRSAGLNAEMVEDICMVVKYTVDFSTN